MGEVWELDLPQNAAWVLMSLCDHAEHDGTKVFPGNGYTAWKTGFSVSTVKRIMRDLRDRYELIELVAKGGGREAAEWRVRVENFDRYRKQPVPGRGRPPALEHIPEGPPDPVNPVQDKPGRGTAMPINPVYQKTRVNLNRGQIQKNPGHTRVRATITNRHWNRQVPVGVLAHRRGTQRRRKSPTGRTPISRPCAGISSAWGCRSTRGSARPCPATSTA
jgi:hypothetical protein